MSQIVDETSLHSHYRFGENWSAFARGLTERDIEHAIACLARLVPPVEMARKRFIDIGSGSGLSGLAALRLGAGSVRAIDLDPQSVETTRAVLGRFAPDGDWNVTQASVFDLRPGDEIYDIVHSWGVLHHTGAMWRAIEACLPLVAAGGYLVLALYRETPMCGFWRREKRFYSRAGRFSRLLARNVYAAAYTLGLLATGRNPLRYIRGYTNNRGMAWMTDVEDWLGGYPYESVSPEALDAFLSGRGFVRERMFAKPARLKGLLGSHCDEFVYRRG